MKSKRIFRIIALILCAVMMISVFSGCQSDESEENTGRNFEAARAAYDADEIVMTIDGQNVTWNEFFGWICFAIADYEATYGTISDFSTSTALGNMSDTIIQDAVYYITMFRAVEKKAAELGIEYADDIEDQMADDWEASLGYYDTEEELIEFVNNHYGSRELYEYIFKIDTLSPDLFEYYFGNDGEKLTDEQIEEGSEGYVMAKHILIHTTDEDTGLVLEDEELEAAQNTIESIYDMLCNYDGDDLEGYFDQLTAQYTQDEGYLTYPDGYLFKEGDMVTEFYNAATGVEEGQFSKIIESTYGYHIVMRIPIDLDAVPINYARYGYSYSLRYIIAQNEFSKESESWTENVSVETTDAFDAIDLTQAFPVQ